MAMVEERVGENRTNAIYRILFVVLLVGGSVLFPPATLLLGAIWLLAIIAAFLWFVVDVLWQLATNGSGWTERSMGAAGWLERLFYWPIDMLEWAFLGRGSFPWIP